MAAAIPAADKHYLVVVADESAAILYTAKKRRGPLEEWRRFENEAARMKTGDLISDRGGRSFDSHGQGRHTMASEKAGPRQHIATQFAKTVAETIAQEMRGGRCAGYSLIVAPRFLGELRKEIGKLVRTSPLATVDKDVIGMDVAVVEKLLESG